MAKIRRIDQMLPCFAEYDAIGGHVKRISEMLNQRGYESTIYTEVELHQTKNAAKLLVHHKPDPCAITLYHHSTGTALTQYLTHVPGYKIVDYHNITPCEYYDFIQDEPASRSCRNGLLGLDILSLFAHEAWADSTHNTGDLLDSGIKRCEVLPIMRDYSHLAGIDPESALLHKLDDGKLNLLFVGRVTPNKCQHELLLLTKAYSICRKKPARLILIGGISPGYYAKIVKIADALGLKIARDLTSQEALRADVLLLGQTTDREMATLYRASDYFVCLSEHEGFCVPLVEAMFFGLPIIANRSTAIPETLGDGGVLVDKTMTPEFVKTTLDWFDNAEVRVTLRERALKRAQGFAWPKLEARFDAVLSAAVDRAAASLR